VLAHVARTPPDDPIPHAGVFRKIV